jgi:ceramide glucosyltransferase
VPAVLSESVLATFKFIMFFVWAAAMVISIWAWEVARMFARRMLKEADRKRSLPAGEKIENTPRPWPRAAVILPIKGVDADTAQNLRALLAQDYPAYRLLFAVQAADDPVVSVLQKLKGEASAGITVETVIAGPAATRGQKIHNQLAAIAHTTDADEVLVFMDADARPARHWLRDLVQPLTETTDPINQKPKRPADIVGAATGFRFYIPQPGPDGTTALPGIMVSVINAAVAALLGPGWRNIAWGGSMALFRRDFFSFGIAEAWQNALSDDYVLSWCVKNKAKRKIQFVFGCLVASEATFSWPVFWEFASRQYRITKICAPGVWLAAGGAALLYLSAISYTLVFFLLSACNILPADYLLGVMFLAIYGCNWMRGRFLLQGALAGFPDHAPQLRRASFWYTWAYPVSLAVNLLAILRSAPGRTIQWRGIRYIMHSRFKTTVVRTLQNGP